MTYTSKWMDIVLFMFVLLSTGGNPSDFGLGGFLFDLTWRKMNATV
jgi:hypothetical protein